LRCIQAHSSSGNNGRHPSVYWLIERKVIHFFRACYEGRFDCAKTLLAYGGNALLLKENIWAETPLHAVCTGGKHLGLLNFLLGIDAVFIDHQVSM